MKKLISILIIAILLFATAGCSCGLSCCGGGGQKVPEKKGDVNIAYDNALTEKLLAYYQANQGYVVTGKLLTADTDLADVSAKIAVLKDAAMIEKLTAAGWKETAHWTEAQKAENEKLFGFTVLEGPDGASSENALKALLNWLGSKEAAELYQNDMFKDLKN